MEFVDNRKQKKTAGINITSLVDVLFIILIFVLVSTTFLEQPALNIELPEAKTAGLQRVEKLVVSISEKGQIYFNDTPIKKEDLGPKLQMYIKKEGEELPVILKADKKVNYGLVINVMDIMRSVGISKLVALTTPSNDIPQ